LLNFCSISETDELLNLAPNAALLIERIRAIICVMVLPPSITFGAHVRELENALVINAVVLVKAPVSEAMKA